MLVIVLWCVFCYFFFFSSRRRHTRCSRDWSSDVCSSDLRHPGEAGRRAIVNFAERVYLEGFLRGLAPEPTLSVSEWADTYRVLSSTASAEPGQWRTARTPYLREIMDCLSPFYPAQRIVVQAGAQIGKTES